MSETGFTHSGFFALRTPLLPLEFLRGWGGTDDEERLRARLHEIFEAPDIRDALFIASPAIEEALRRDANTKDLDKRNRLEAGLTKYLMRMAGRCTPFGLFAGVSTGTIAPKTVLCLGPRSGYRRFTRIDMGYLSMLVDGLMRDPTVRNAVRFRPNSTLYVTGDRARYVEHRPGQRARSYFLVSADLDEGLKAVLDLAASGSTREDLAQALTRDGIEPEEALAYVDELIDGQVLEPDLAPAVTGGDPMADLEGQLSAHPGLEGFAGTLAGVRARLQAIDAEGIGAAPERYRDVATEVKAFPADANIDRLFQVDMAKPAETLTLSESLLEEVGLVAALLGRMFGGTQGDPFEDFKRAFTERWSEREIPLLEALDEECGVGFRAARSIASETSPLLAGIVFPSGQGETRIAWGVAQDFLLRRLTEGRPDPSAPLVLTEEDLARFPARPVSLPSAFSVMLTLLAPPVESETPRLLWLGLAGPSGGRMLGRFCHTDPDLLRGVRDHLRAEEALDPDRLYCEIVHLPEGRIGNVIARPILREHEIVFLARAGAPEERRIPLSDLRVSVRGGRVILRSKRLGREIVPRLTNAHNFSMGIGVYRFLAMLQGQGALMGLSWQWGPFESLPFLPRVTYRNVILSPARWTAATREARGEEKEGEADPLQKCREWANRLKLPRWVGLREGDNVLPVDRENPLSLRAFLDAIDGRPQFTLTELPWLEGAGLVTGPEGTYANEVIIPLVQRAPVPAEQPRAGRPEARQTPLEGAITQFLPGSEWLFARFNTAPGFADSVLVDSVGPVVESLRRDRVAEDWFFIRYSDPEFHLRLRIRGAPAALVTEALPRLHAIAGDLLARGLVTKVLYDTYDRELSRYGGPNGIELCERIFGIDSDTVLELVASTLGDEGAVARWQLTLCGIDSLLRDAGLDLEQRYFFADRMAGVYGREFNLEGFARHPIQDKFRKERRSLFELLEGLEMLRRRSERLAPALAELKERSERGDLAVSFTDILGSLIHMHANRMLPTAARAQEAVLYRFLENLYDSQLARAGKKKKDRRDATASE
jgi:thiopeptide-type bacteriocin biosynthesis protein